MQHNNNLAELESVIGYQFKDKNLLRTALAHSSYANEKRIIKSNERLEFLGDAVLSIIVSKYLFETCTDKQEGELTKLRASLVCESTLAGFSRKMGLGAFLLLGKGEANNGGAERPSILADAFEALLAAIYLDGGIDNARAHVLRFVEPMVRQSGGRPMRDYKTLLQEMAQQDGEGQLDYRLVSQTGPDHNKHFVVEVWLNSNMVGRGGGRSKKEAEQQAAQKALELFGL